MLLHSCPLQLPHAVTHFNPLLRQVHDAVPQTFFDSILQLHRINFVRASGPGGKSVLIGVITLFWTFQPHSSGFRQSRPKYFHFETWRCTRREWKKVALSVGGSDSGWTFVPLVTMVEYLAYLKTFKKTTFKNYSRLPNKRVPIRCGIFFLFSILFMNFRKV